MFVSILSLLLTAGLIRRDSARNGPQIVQFLLTPLYKGNMYRRVEEICYEMEKPEGKKPFRGPRR